MAVLEPVVFACEAGIYAWSIPLPLRRACAASFLANAASAAVGVAGRLLAG